MNYFSNKKGFAMITLVVFVSSILFSLILIKSLDNITFFDLAMKKYYRALNYYNALSCINEAYVLIELDYFIDINESINFKELNCDILSIKREGDRFLIKVRGSYMNAYIYLTR